MASVAFRHFLDHHCRGYTTIKDIQQLLISEGIGEDQITEDEISDFADILGSVQ